MEKWEYQELFAKHVNTLGFSARTEKCLKENNIHTLKEIICRTEKDIEKFRGFGKKCLPEIKEKLKEYGLSLVLEDNDQTNFSAIQH